MHQVPDYTCSQKADEDDACIVHRHFSHRQRRRHAEYYELEYNPQHGNNIHRIAYQGRAMPPCSHDFFAAVRQAENDWDAVATRQSDNTDGDECGEC